MSGTTIREIYCREIAIEDLTVYLASSKKGAVRTGITLKKECDCIDYFAERLPGRRLLKGEPENRELLQAVEAALLNRPTAGDLKYDVSLTPFQWKALRTIILIPFGETRTYGEIAALMGKPRAPRAVGQAMGKNPFPLVFP